MSALVHDAVVLAGGEGRRLGGVSKAEVPVAGRPMLDHVLAATGAARRVVVVGPAVLARPGVPTVREHPPSGGPVAGIDAGLTFLDARTLDVGTRGDGHARGTECVGTDDAAVLVLACDVPRAAGVVPALLETLALMPEADGVHLVDRDGHAQLVAVYRRPALAAALAGLVAAGGVHGVSVRRLAERLSMVPLADPEGHGRDADTWDDVQDLDVLIREAGS